MADINQIFEREERETILLTSDADDIWEAYTSSPKMMKKFEKAGWKCTKNHYYDGVIVAKTFEAPIDQVAIKAKRKKKELTEEQLKKLQERAKLMQEKKKKK